MHSLSAVSFPTVAIIVPVHNAEDTLYRCLLSIQQQTYPYIEVVVILDSCTDASRDRIGTFKFNRIIVCECQFKSASKSRQLGFAKCSGDFVIYLDADDYFHPRRVEYAVRALRNFVTRDSLALNYYSNLIVTNASSQFIHSFDCQYYLLHNPSKPVHWYLALLGGLGNGFMAPLHCWTIPRKIHEDITWNPLLTVDDDGEFIVRLLAQIESIIIVPYYLSIYTRDRTRRTLSNTRSLDAAKSALRSAALKKMHIDKSIIGDSTCKSLCRRAFSSTYTKLLMSYFPIFPRLSLLIITSMISQNLYFSPSSSMTNYRFLHFMPGIRLIVSIAVSSLRNIRYLLKI